ncbi:MAG TPA: 16S rRNA (adenine(1518)-N(6)/adenine(1519)-N(6))-dimethyltransferase RsmA [Burkholderiales bacterium]|nr:16S rRNA (adenine(1518)-N(6)/adenine(1519)-N(6))-dimethyltransferase RsmA [Burkholderiales bacterium]
MQAHTPRRRFGQNFLTDRAVVAKIIAAIAPAPEDHIVEIGPGPGALTEPLLQVLDTLDVIEIDRDLARALLERFSPTKLHVHQADALTFDFSTLPSPLRVVGNLPYNISSPLLFRLAQYAERLRDCHFMLQREVADRMAAAPGSKIYGRLSVMLQYRFQVEKLFKVAPGSFWPVPKVESAMVRLTPLGAQRLRACDEAVFSRLVASAFSQRRKTLRNALRDLVDESSFRAARVDASLRAEALPVHAFVRLADALVSDARISGPCAAE